MNRTDLQTLADARIADALALLDAGRWAAAYYLLGYAAECGMKACAVRQFRQDGAPDKTIVNDFYTHRLDKLLSNRSPYMAENAMVKEQLTEGMIDAGAKLTAKLDEAGVPIVAAFWLFMPDMNEWRLIFASPEVNTRGPRAVYDKVWRAVEAAGESRLPFSMIGVMDEEADLVRLLKAGFHTGPGIARLRFSKNVINGHFIDDALIYRAA